MKDFRLLLDQEASGSPVLSVNDTQILIKHREFCHVARYTMRGAFRTVINI